MTAYFQHIEGSKKGQVESFDLDLIRVGRLSDNDLKFNPYKDREVSGNHAEIVRQGDTFIIKDLQSSNGTFVNKRRINQPTPIADGDMIEFSTRGPKVIFSTKEPAVGTIVVDQAALGQSAVGHKTISRMINDALVEAQSAETGRLGGTAVFMRELFKQASSRSSRRSRLILISILVLLFEIIGALVYVNYRNREEMRRLVIGQEEQQTITKQKEKQER